MFVVDGTGGTRSKAVEKWIADIGMKVLQVLVYVFVVVADWQSGGCSEVVVDTGVTLRSWLGVRRRS
jgi:hypothetical protein